MKVLFLERAASGRARASRFWYPQIDKPGDDRSLFEGTRIPPSRPCRGLSNVLLFLQWI